MRIFSKPKKTHFDYFLLGLIFILTLSGLIILTSASSDIGKLKYDNSYFYIKHQVLYGLLLGIAGGIATFFFPYKYLKNLSPYLLLGNVILLVLVLTPLGVTSGGSSRWLEVGGLTFQPAEFLKLTFIVFIAAWLSNARQNRAGDFKKGFVPFALVCGIVAALLVLQPATSTVAILMLSALAVYIISGAKFKYVALFIGLGVLALATLVLSTEYRRDRVMSFLRQDDNLGNNYHLNQALIAIGSGRLAGTGFGQSTAKVTYLPAVIDDSIFAVAAQELGYIGAATIVVLFMLLTIRLFWLAMNTPDSFGKLILVGFGCIIGLQSFTNIGSISGVLPLTGVPLPFISYGGTALMVFLTMSGLALNISKNGNR